MIAKNPNAHYVVALFDIDDFKFINDIYGHVYGDRALKNLADSMKISFPSDALLGRNGGDEFCILLPNRTYDDAKEQFQQFTMLPKIFSYKENDELFYANHEFLHMAGYKNINELFKLTKKSFRNLIREDEQQQIEASIWQQIDSGNENDYIYFHLRKADGTYLSVLDHGRIVENQQYGRVFYVLFMDWADMHIRYSDKFSE